MPVEREAAVHRIIASRGGGELLRHYNALNINENDAEAARMNDVKYVVSSLGKVQDTPDDSGASQDSTGKMSYGPSGHDVGVHMNKNQTPSAPPSSGLAYPNLTDEQKLFIATVAGEAGGSSDAAQRAVANVIMNRVGYKEWKDRDTIGKNLTRDQFSSINDPQNQPFNEMTEYLKYRDGSNPRLERLINLAMNVYHRKEPDSTGGAVIFYSPKAQAQKNQEDAEANPNPPRWNYNELEDLVVPGAEDDDFRFFKYK